MIHSSQGAMPLWLDHRLLLATADVNTLSPAEIANCIRKSTDGNPTHRLVTRILAEDAPDQDNVTAVPVAAEDLPPNIADPGARAGGNVAF